MYGLYPGGLCFFAVFKSADSYAGNALLYMYAAIPSPAAETSNSADI
jgi:hypothetical protein